MTVKGAGSQGSGVRSRDSGFCDRDWISSRRSERQQGCAASRRAHFPFRRQRAPRPVASSFERRASGPSPALHGGHAAGNAVAGPTSRRRRAGRPHVTPAATTQAAEQASCHASVVHCGAAKPNASRHVQAGKLEARPAPPLRLTANDPSGAPATHGARWRTTGAPHESPAISSSSRAGGDTA